MKVSKKEIKQMILKEMAMMAIRPARMESHYQQDGDYHMGQEPMSMPDHSKMSKEACCIAIKAIAECCECPDTKAAMIQFCNTVR